MPDLVESSSDSEKQVMDRPAPVERTLRELAEPDLNQQPLCIQYVLARFLARLQRLVWRRRRRSVATVNSGWRFLEMAVGERRKKNMDLGFHGFYYGDWKRNLFNILTAKGSKYVLTQSCPPEPSLYDYRNQREPYKKWYEANKMAKRYILASISVELHKKHQSMETATEIMASLHQMFGQNTHFAREATLKRITDTKMEEGTKVCDHVLKMMDYLNEVEIHGVQINDKSKINMVIESLPDTFKEFKEEQQQPADQHRIILEQPSLLEPRRSGRVTRLPARYMLLGETYTAISDEHVQDPTSYNEALIDRDVEFFEKGCKWIYKRKKGVDRRLETFKARLVAEGFTQKEGINYEETFSPVAMLKSIRILLSIAAVLDYEIWQMDVKTAFLNRHLEENIYMQQLDRFIQKMPRTHEVLTTIKIWLAKQFNMKDLGEISYVLGIKLLRDRKNKTSALSQAVYIDKILARFSMENSKTGLLPFRHGITFSKDQSPKTSEEIERMRRVPYAEVVGVSCMPCFALPDICFVVGMVSRYQFNPGPQYWTAVKHIMTYLKRTKNYMLGYSGDELIPVGYTDSDFMLDKDSRKSTSGYVFILGSGAISWMSVKQSCITDLITKAEYVATSEAAKEAIWLRKFLRNLEVVPVVTAPLKLFCDNGGAVAQSKEPRNYKKQNILTRSCFKLENVPETLGQVESLEELDISGTAIRQPLSSIFLMKNLKELSCRGCKGSPSSASWFLRSPINLMRWSSDPVALSLPSSLSGLCSLTKLDISDCDLGEGAIPSSIGDLCSLEKLCLSRNSFVSLPASIYRLSNLQEIELEECKMLQTLPRLPASIQWILLDGCVSLETLSDVLKLNEHRLPLLSLECVDCLKLTGNYDLATLKILRSVSHSHLC
ncbi:hypothetical protein KPL70_007964 [Citrus sinensis]|nr:hypothetical protein KPL70_007964 [Citrus sinensis]